MTMKKLATAAVLTLITAACAGSGAEQAVKPVGVGSDTNEYKGSPCACMELEQPAPSAKDLLRFQRALG